MTSNPQEIRAAENREIGALNARHADYISEVRFLQAVHRKLTLRLDQWVKAGKPSYAEKIREIVSGVGNGSHKLEYDAQAEKLPSLTAELDNARSRYEAAVRGRDMGAEDSLLVRLCEVRSQICLAKGRGRVIEEECARLRLENQKLLGDIDAQRKIFDRETQERYTYERRAVPLLEECDELLRKCKLVQAFNGYTVDDIEADRKRWRAELEASMGDIRRQYEILASTVNSEMEQWFKEQVIGIDFKTREDASSHKKKLAALRAELVDVRTRLAHLEERNRLLTSLIGDFEDARDQEQKIAGTCLQEEENQIKQLIDRYNALTAPTPHKGAYTVATLRAEILRYRELLDGVGPTSNRLIRNGFNNSGGRAGSSYEIGTGVNSHYRHVSGGASSHHSGSVGAAHSVHSQIGSGVAAHSTHSVHSQIGSGVAAHSAHSQIGSGVAAHSAHSQIGSGVAAHSVHSPIGSGVAAHSVHSQVGSGVVVDHTAAAQEATSEGSGVWSSKHYAWKPATVVSTADYTLRDAHDTAGVQKVVHEQEYSMHRSAQGNVTIGEVAPDGSYVIIQNTSLNNDQNIGEWTLRSTSSSLKQVSYTFPVGFVLTPQNTVQVFARGKGAHNPPHSVVCETDATFATGDDLDIYLYDNYNQERARLTQRSFFRPGAIHSTF